MFHSLTLSLRFAFFLVLHNDPFRDFQTAFHQYPSVSVSHDLIYSSDCFIWKERPCSFLCLNLSFPRVSIHQAFTTRLAVLEGLANTSPGSPAVPELP